MDSQTKKRDTMRTLWENSIFLASASPLVCPFPIYQFNSFTFTLEYFHLLTSRFQITYHEDNTLYCSINCNNKATLFIHAATKYITVNDILKPTYQLHLHHSFFLMDGSKTTKGHHRVR